MRNKEMSKTLQEQYAEALLKRGERLVKRLHSCDVYTRSEGGFYYIGGRGSLRFGPTRSGSIPCSQRAKDVLMEGI